MALKQRFMVKHQWSGVTLSLKPDSGQALLVESIEIDNTTPTEFTKVYIDRVMIAYLSTYNMYTNQFWIGRDQAKITTLMRTLFDKGIFKGFPVADGQELTIDYTGSGSPYVRVFYRIYDAEDINSEMENGSKAKEYLFYNYGTNTLQIDVDATGLIDKSLNPIEFPDFPYGAVVPAKTEIDIIGILIATHRKAAYVGDKMRWLKFTKEREVLFDPDRRGFYCAHGMNEFPFHAVYYEHPFNMFPEPITFKAGEELTLQMTIGTSNLAALAGLFCLVQKVRKVE